jgi:hemerythrin
MALQWTTALSLGVPELDAQHAELFGRVDRLLDAMILHDRSEAVRLIGFLERYVEEHFDAEERLMRESGYPDAALHVAEHRAFRADISGLVASLAAEGPTARIVLRLEREVTSWLRDHVYSTDHCLARWLLSRPPVSAAAQVAPAAADGAVAP